MYGLYVHIPFCVKKCKYCDFVSFDERNELKKEYVSSLIKEMEEYRGEKIDSVFIGGGTPTSLDKEDIERLLKKIREIFVISPDAEITTEANPKTLDEGKLFILKENGVNRISLGVQSFLDNELSRIGRVHDAEDAKNTIELIKKEGFSNFNIDIISAIPDQTFESFVKTLKIATEQNPTHISCYSLILEEGTPLFEEYENGKLNLPDEDEERKMYEYTCEFLEENGYIQYEISNFAKKGYESKHNIKYWKCEEYIGVGLSAHSYYRGERFYNTSDIKKYLQGDWHNIQKESRSLKDKMEEFMIMGLRMSEGISKSDFYLRFGKDIKEVYKKQIEELSDKGFLIENEDKICLSHDAISVSNSILCEFILD